jgi:hypothetical protein
MTSIKAKWFNPKLSGSYSGVVSFLKNRNLKLPKDEVEKELLKLKEYYMYRPARSKFKKRRVLVFLPNWLVSLDLIDLQKYSSENNGAKYVLVAIDNFTKKLYTEILKSKHATNVVRALKSIFKRMGQTPRVSNT